MASGPTLHFGPFFLDGTDDGPRVARAVQTPPSRGRPAYLVAHPGRLVRKLPLGNRLVRRACQRLGAHHLYS